MPGTKGIESGGSDQITTPETVVIGLSVDAGVDTQTARLEAGAAMLLTKENTVEELDQAIQQALEPRAPA